MWNGTRQQSEDIANQRRGMSGVWSPDFALLLLGQATFGFAFSCFFLLPKWMEVALGADVVAIGEVTAVAGASIVLFMLLAGGGVNRVGALLCLRTGAALMAGASLCYLTLDTVGWALMLLRIVQALAFSLSYVGGSTLIIGRAPPGREAQVLGIYGVSVLCMGCLGPVVMEILAKEIGWSLAFLCPAAGASLSLLSSFFGRDIGRANYALAQVDPSASVAVGPGEDREERPLLEMLRVMGHRPQREACIVLLLVGAGYGAVVNYHQLYALSLGFDDVASFFMANSLAAIFMRAGTSHLIDRVGPGRVAAVMLLLYALSALAVIELEIIGLIGLGLMFGVAHGLFYPAYTASVIKRESAADRGRCMGLFQAYFNAGLTIGVYGLARVAEASGYPAVFLSAAGILVLAAVLVAGSEWSRSVKRRAVDLDISVVES